MSCGVSYMSPCTLICIVRGAGLAGTGWGVHYGRRPVRRDSAREAFNRHKQLSGGVSACAEHADWQGWPRDLV